MRLFKKQGCRVNLGTAQGASGRRQRGFTLMEMLVVIAILGILVAVGIPSYSRYVEKTKRRAVQAHMMEIAGVLENGNTQYGGYLEKQAAAFNGLYPENAPRYRIEVKMVTPGSAMQLVTPSSAGERAFPGYVIFAFPLQKKFAGGCGALILDNFLVKSVQDANKTAAECWN